ncbi:hypothetical protein DINM_000167 [Dirofilaria immitis]|nr:hypothetical protein [Dirofilaria immitis]
MGSVNIRKEETLANKVSYNDTQIDTMSLTDTLDDLYSSCTVLHNNHKVKACLPEIPKMDSNHLLKDKPCNDVRRKKIQVGRNPIRYEDTYDYGPHESCKKDEECPPHFKCEKGCCL